MSEAEELEKLCKPVVDWLKKNHDPHTEVHITVAAGNECRRETANLYIWSDHPQ